MTVYISHGVSSFHTIYTCPCLQALADRADRYQTFQETRKQAVEENAQEVLKEQEGALLMQSSLLERQVEGAEAEVKQANLKHSKRVMRRTFKKRRTLARCSPNRWTTLMPMWQQHSSRA